MLEAIFHQSFPLIFPAAGSSYPTSLFPLETIVAQVDELTSLIEFELTALEVKKYNENQNIFSKILNSSNIEKRLLARSLNKSN